MIFDSAYFFTTAQRDGLSYVTRNQSSIGLTETEMKAVTFFADSTALDREIAQIESTYAGLSGISFGRGFLQNVDLRAVVTDYEVSLFVSEQVLSYASAIEKIGTHFQLKTGTTPDFLSDSVDLSVLGSRLDEATDENIFLNGTELAKSFGNQLITIGSMFKPAISVAEVTFAKGPATAFDALSIVYDASDFSVDASLKAAKQIITFVDTSLPTLVTIFSEDITAEDRMTAISAFTIAAGILSTELKGLNNPAAALLLGIKKITDSVDVLAAIRQISTVGYTETASVLNSAADAELSKLMSAFSSVLDAANDLVPSFIYGDYATALNQSFDAIFNGADYQIAYTNLSARADHAENLRALSDDLINTVGTTSGISVYEEIGTASFAKGSSVLDLLYSGSGVSVGNGAVTLDPATPVTDPNGPDDPDPVTTPVTIAEVEAPPPYLVVSNATVVEGSGQEVQYLEFKVRAFGEVTENINFRGNLSWAAENGSGDINDLSGATWQITAGGRDYVVVRVPVLSDELPERTETVNLSLSNVTGAVVRRASDITATGTIHDDDSTAIAFNSRMSEQVSASADGKAYYGFTTDSSGTFSVDITNSNGNVAVRVLDYLGNFSNSLLYNFALAGERLRLEHVFSPNQQYFIEVDTFGDAASFDILLSNPPTTPTPSGGWSVDLVMTEVVYAGQVLTPGQILNESFAPGDEITVDYTIHNAGTAQIGITTAMLAGNFGLDHDASAAPVGVLAAGASFTVQDAKITVPNIAETGTYTIAAFADPAGQVDEGGRTGNNALTFKVNVETGSPAPVTIPDTGADDPDAPIAPPPVVPTGPADIVVIETELNFANLLPGANFDAGYKILNQGEARSERGILDLYLSRDTVLDTSDIFVGSEEFSRLSANATDAERIYGTLPNNLSAGTYHVLFVAETLDGEATGANNIGTASFVIDEVPDQTISVASLDFLRIIPGEVPELTYAVTNIGKAATGYTELGFFISDTDSFADARYLGSPGVSLAAGETVGRERRDLTAILDGEIDSTLDQHFFLVANYENVGPERTFGNNRSEGLSLNPAFMDPGDLIVTDLSLSSTVIDPDNRPTLSFAVENLGEATVQSAMTGFFAAQVSDPSKVIYLGALGVSLNGGQSKVDSFTFPQSWTAKLDSVQEYQFYAVANHDGAIPESNNFNNTSASIRIALVNEAPVAQVALLDRSFAQDNTVVIALPSLAFVDPDGDVLSLSASLANGVALPEWLTFDAANNIFTGAPDLGDIGAYQVTVTATDGGKFTQSEFTLNIGEPTNYAPFTTGDTAEVGRGSVLVLEAASLLENDVDVENQTLSLISVGGATGGTVVLRSDGTVSFTPDVDAPARSGFSYIVADSAGGQSEGFVAISVTDSLASNNNDQLFGTAQRDLIDGLAGDDRIEGRAGDDELNGSSGNDILVGGAGADVLNGGSGIDRAQYTDAAVGVLADLQFSNLNRDIAAGDTYVSIENLYGSAFGDDLRGDAANNILWGHNGNDRLFGRNGNDNLQGMNGNDVLVGGAGNDLLNGGAGFDMADYSDVTENIVANINFNNAQRISASAGIDTFISVEGLMGGTGNDLLVGTIGGNVIDGGAGDDQIYGIGGGDILRGGIGNDLIEGSGGNDTMAGGDGDGDVLSYYNSAGRVAVDLRLQGTAQSVGGSSGIDTFTEFEDLYGSNTGGDILVGSSVANLLVGFGGADRIFGFGGADELIGMQGNDILNGGLGADTLSGGGGADIFDFNTVEDSFLLERDVITDFGVGSDIVDLSGIDADTSLAGNQAFNFVGRGALSGAGDLRFASNGADGFILGDVDGDGSFDFNIALLGVTSLLASDIFL